MNLSRQDEETHGASFWHGVSPEAATAEAIRKIRSLVGTDQNWLDLGNLGLLEVPREIEVLKHQLEILSLGGKSIVTDNGHIYTGIGGVFRRRNIRRLRNIDSLASLARLNWLDLSHCEQLANIIALANLTYLTSLSLKGCKVTSLAPLAHLAKLTELELSCRVTHINPLANLIQLTSLELNVREDLMSIEPLANLTNLTSLVLGGIQHITSILPLTRLANLSRLNLYGCKQMVLNARVARLEKMTHISFSGCDMLTDIAPLGSLVLLESIGLTSCRSVISLEPLCDLPALAKLDISDSDQLLSQSAVGLLANRGVISSLSAMHCRSITSIATLPSLLSLKSLDLSDCSKLECVEALSSLLNLTHLDLAWCEQIKEVHQLASLAKLISLRLHGCTQLTSLPSLEKLTSLSTVDLSSCDNLIDIEPLGSLTALEDLDLSKCLQLTDLPPLERLNALATLNLSGCEQLTSVEPLRSLSSALTKLNLSNCKQLTSVEPLGSLSALVTLDLSGCEQLTSVNPLRSLSSALTTLDLSNCKQLASVEPLGSLSALVTLILFGCEQLTSVESLAKLSVLTTLDLSNCEQLHDVTPLKKAVRLVSLGINNTSLSSFAQLDELPRLRVLYAYGSKIRGLHSSVCGAFYGDNCLASVRRYYRDLKKGAQPDAELKVFVLGNGRAGKSYLIRRLLGETFKKIEMRKPPTTHGFEIKNRPCPNDWKLPQPTQLVIWDFGGQDIYHGTHALFLREPAIYVVCYSKDTENEEIVHDGGFEMRNRRLRYWFDYLRQEAGSRGVVASPVITVECQDDDDKNWIAENAEPDRAEFPGFLGVVHSSAKREDGHLTFVNALKECVGKLLIDQPQPPLPKSWQSVREYLRAMQGRITASKTLTQAKFRAICERHGCGESAPVLRDALHQMGVVFYRQGVFDDRIIIDQNWIMDKIYVLFDRKREDFRLELKDKNGLFRRSDLQRHFWSADSVINQRLYLSFMEQSGICFRADPDENYSYDYEGRYIAPDLLPRWEEGPDKEHGWSPDQTTSSVTATFPLLHDGISRALLTRIGRVSRNRAAFWRYGCYFRDATTLCEVLIRCMVNIIRIEVRELNTGQGDPAKLLQTLVDIIQRIPTGAVPEVRWHRPELQQPHRAGSEKEDSPPEDRLQPMKRQSRLEKAVPGVHGHSKQLMKFYYIGCAYRDGFGSFKSIASEFGEREREFSKHIDLPMTDRGVSNVIEQLTKRVFRAFFKVGSEADFKLVQHVIGKNKTTQVQLNEWGRKAWEATKEHVAIHCNLPGW